MLGQVIYYYSSKCRVIIWPTAAHESIPDLKSNSTVSGGQLLYCCTGKYTRIKEHLHRKFRPENYYYSSKCRAIIWPPAQCSYQSTPELKSNSTKSLNQGIYYLSFKCILFKWATFLTRKHTRFKEQLH